jgi:hypothetical protein
MLKTHVPDQSGQALVTVKAAYKYYKIKYLERIKTKGKILVDRFRQCQGFSGSRAFEIESRECSAEAIHCKQRSRSLVVAATKSRLFPVEAFPGLPLYRKIIS